MRRFLLLCIVAVVTFLAIYLVKNPDVVDKMWLYVVGLIGGIIKIGKMIIDKAYAFLTKKDEVPQPPPAPRVINPAKRIFIAKS